MSAAIEKLGRHLVAGKVVDTAKRNKDVVVALGILTEGDAQLHTLNLQGHVDKSLAVALYILEALHIVARKGEICRMTVSQHLHLLIQDVALKTEAVFAEGMDHVAVYLVFVYSFGKQLADDEG